MNVHKLYFRHSENSTKWSICNSVYSESYITHKNAIRIHYTRSNFEIRCDVISYLRRVTIKCVCIIMESWVNTSILELLAVKHALALILKLDRVYICISSELYSKWWLKPWRNTVLNRKLSVIISNHQGWFYMIILYCFVRYVYVPHSSDWIMLDWIIFRIMF